MTDFDTAVTFVLANEGGLIEDASDPGGITNFGISLRFLTSLNQNYDPTFVKLMTIDQAKLIYKNEFWAHNPYYQIINQRVCNYVFDAAVNMGPATAIKIVQRALWALNKQINFVADDGILGAKTLDAINNAGFLLCGPLLAERAGYYRQLAASNPDQKKFIDGWLNRAYRI